MKDLILMRMAELYVMFCMPQITIGEEVSLVYKWTNPEAEALYDKLAELLAHINSRDAELVECTLL